MGATVNVDLTQQQLFFRKRKKTFRCFIAAYTKTIQLKL